MWRCCVSSVVPDVSEDHVAVIFRVTAGLIAPSPFSIENERNRPSETSGTSRPTKQRHILEALKLQRRVYWFQFTSLHLQLPLIRAVCPLQRYYYKLSQRVRCVYRVTPTYELDTFSTPGCNSKIRNAMEQTHPSKWRGIQGRSLSLQSNKDSFFNKMWKG
jgi:hypothetical protein